MPLTTLDPKTALVVIDLQKGIVAHPLVHPTETIVAHAVALVDAFRAHGLPVVLVNVDGGAPGRTDVARKLPPMPAGWTDLVPELRPQPSDHLLTKKTPGAFANTGLSDFLKQQLVTQVVVIGISTSNGVESTARQAYELGFHVTLPIDAMTDREVAAHDYSIQKVFPRIAETGTTQEVLDLLTPRSSQGSPRQL